MPIPKVRQVIVEGDAWREAAVAGVSLEKCVEKLAALGRSFFAILPSGDAILVEWANEMSLGTVLITLRPEAENESRCTCGNDYIEPHTCPYKKDVNDDHKTLCSCCPHCTRACGDDI